MGGNYFSNIFFHYGIEGGIMEFCFYCRKNVPTNISEFNFEENGKKVNITEYKCMYCGKTIKIYREEKSV
jgi:hypothetical protein